MGASNWETWIGEEVSVDIWEMSAGGSILSKIRAEKFWQSVSTTTRRYTTTFREPGVAYEEERSRIIGYEVEIQTLLQRADEQLTPFEDPDRIFRILLTLHNTENPSLNQQETRDYRFARLTSGPDEAHQDNDSSTVTLRFFAQEKV